MFLDIETVHGHKDYDVLDNRTQQLRSKKSTQIKKRSSECESMTDEELYYDKAWIYAEYGKIVVISVGMIRKNWEYHIKSYFGHDEKKLLGEFFDMVNEHYDDDKSYLCGHNAKEFDVPYLCRRGLIHGISLPSIMPSHGEKPWEMRILDTMEMRKFGDRKAYTSLDLLCNIFNIWTPKNDINGSEVSGVYWNDSDLERIREYCEKDVEALIQVYKKIALIIY